MKKLAPTVEVPGDLYNTRVRKVVKLPAPAVLRARFPLTEEGHQSVLQGREIMRSAVNFKRGTPFIFFFGPCSVTDPDAAFELACELSAINCDLKHSLIMCRMNVEKPRTNPRPRDPAASWKGLLTEPFIGEGPDPLEGLLQTCELYQRLANAGVHVVTEALNDIFCQLYAHFLSSAWIGARSVSDPDKRALASILSFPVGMKNGPLAGDGIIAAINGIVSMKAEHVVPSITPEGAFAAFLSTGNPDGYFIPRGFADQTNYSREWIEVAAVAAAKVGIANLPILVDAAHNNMMVPGGMKKDPMRQIAVIDDVVKTACDVSRRVIGAMAEVHFNGGKKDFPTTHGEMCTRTSITDPCVPLQEIKEVVGKWDRSLAKRK